MSEPAAPTFDAPALAAMTALDRLGPRRGDTQLMANLLTGPATRLLVIIGDKVVIRSNLERTAAALALFALNALPGPPPNLAELLFMGVRPGTREAYFALCLTPENAQLRDRGGQQFAPAVDLRSLAMQGVLLPDDLALAATAVALANWHAEVRFCGRCGGQTRPSDGGWKRTCADCGREQFPCTDPVVIMLPTAGDRCVLARQPQFPDGMMSAIAGFLEPGENIESAVARETAEEIGLTVTRVHYVQSQPWPFPHSLMIGAIAQVPDAPLVIDVSELSHARWFDREEARLILSGTHPDGIWSPGRHAIAHWLLRRFVAQSPSSA